MSKTTGPPGATCLTNLPNEVLMQIVSFLPQNSNWLASLCRVSRLFQDLVEPHLYSTIAMTIDCDERIPDLGTLKSEHGGSRVSRFSSLVNTLSKYPSLCRYSQVLWLKAGHCDGVFKGQAWKEQAGCYPSLNLQLPLLQLLPSLRDLHLNPPPMFIELPGMPTLRSLHLDFGAIYHLPGDIDIDDLERNVQLAKYRTLSNCLIIPSLRVLRIEGLHPHSDYFPLVAFPELGHRSSSISDLQIICCSALTSAALIEILLSICALRRLVLECSRQPGFNDGDDELPYDTLSQALEPHRGHMEELIIACRDGTQLEDTIPISSLADYVAMKRMAIPAHLLGAYDGITTQRALQRLPRQLEELQLQHCTNDGVNMAVDMEMRILLYQSLAANKATCLPALRRVVWWCQTKSEIATEGVYYSADMQALVPLFQNIGIDFQWGWSAEYQSTPFGKSSKGMRSFGQWM